MAGALELIEVPFYGAPSSQRGERATRDSKICGQCGRVDRQLSRIPQAPVALVTFSLHSTLSDLLFPLR